MNFDKITLESFKEIYEYLVYKRQNINKLIEKNEDYIIFMDNLKKKYPTIEITDDKLYYNKLITELEEQFKLKKNNNFKNLKKINLIIDTFDTYNKICHYEKKFKQLNTKIKNKFDPKLKKEIKMIKKMKICNPKMQNILIPVNIISDRVKKEEYLKNNFLNHRLIDNLKSLLGLSGIECQVLINTKKKKFFDNLKKELYSRDDLISKKNILEDELSVFNKIDKFLISYHEYIFFCPFCPFYSNKQFDVYFHHYTNHGELIKICSTIYNGFNKINVDNLFKCPYCPKTFSKENTCNILYHIKINHLFETEKIGEISKHFIEKTQEKVTIVKKKIRKKFQVDPEIYYSIVDKIEHEYSKLFRNPNPCLIKSLIEDEIDDMFDDDIVGNKLHMSIDTALQYSEEILYGKLFKFIRKSLGKKLFDKAGIQSNFGYEDGLMTIENEVDCTLSFLKEELFGILINNIYGNVSSNYTMITKEFSDNFDNLINSFSRYHEVMNSIQNQLDCKDEDKIRSLNEKFEKVYEILKGDINCMKDNLSFLFKFMKRVSKIPDMKNNDNITNLMENLILPNKIYNIKINDNYDENKEEVDLKSFFLLFSYLDKSETSYIVNGIFNNIIKSEYNSRLVEKPYVWTWKYGNFVDEEFDSSFKLQNESIKEYKDGFLNVFTKFDKNIKDNIEENITDFDYLISNINEIEDIEQIYNKYSKIQEILRFFTDMNTNSIVKIKGKQYETVNTFTRNRYKYFNDNNELIPASISEVDKYLSRLFQMRKMILHQKINLIAVITLLHKFLVKTLDEEYMTNGYEQKSFSLFFKRYFQLISLIMSKRRDGNKLPGFEKKFFKKVTKKIVEEEISSENKVKEDIYEIDLDEDSLLSSDSEIELDHCIIEQEVDDDEENIYDGYQEIEDFENGTEDSYSNKDCDE